MKADPLFSDDSLFDPTINHLWVALSGGVDSVVLLHNLIRLDIPLDLIKAIHVNHHLQPMADEFAAFCLDLCDQYQIDIELIDVEVKPGGSVEANARQARYEAFTRVLSKDDVLLLAHHADDQVETMLFRLFRGSSPAGLEGMPARRQLGDGRLYRPLLNVSRSSIVAWARAHDLRWLEDPTNRQLDADRNWIRHELLPMMESRWPGIRRTLLARHAEYESYRAERSAQLLDQLHAQLEAPDCLRLKGLRETENVRELIVFWLKQHQLPLPNVGLLGELNRCIREHERVDIVYQGIELREHRDQLYLLSQLDSRDSSCVPLTVGELEFSGGLITNDRVKGHGLRPGNQYRIATRQGGERLKMGQHKALKNLFQELNVPRWLRDRVPLLFCGDELVAIVGMPEWGVSMQIADDWRAASTDEGLEVVIHWPDRRYRQALI